MAKQYQGKIEQIDGYRWRLPRAESAGMNCSAVADCQRRLYAGNCGAGAGYARLSLWLRLSYRRCRCL